jgi:DNA segregation ATPase FtsK/SpoIIIE-like protein
MVKSNFPVRLVGSVSSPEDAKVATGIAGTGADRLLGQGDFVVVAKGQVTRMQAAYIQPQEISDLVARLARGNDGAIQMLAATGSDGRRSGEVSFSARLRSRLQRVK